MISEILRKHIPSKTYIEYLDEINHEFTDFETAAILSHIYDWKLSKLMKVLSEFLPDVKDAEVKKQIEEFIEEQQQDMTIFADNQDGDYVFVAYAHYKSRGHSEEETIACAIDYNLAYKSCREFTAGEMDDDEFTGASIKKFPLEREDAVKREREKEYYYLNPFLFADTPMEELKVESIVWSKDVGEITLSKDGRVEHLWVKKKEDEEGVRHSYDPALFYNAYITYPNPFELGDIVSLVEAGEGVAQEKNSKDKDSEEEDGSKFPKKIGIIYESQEQYKAFEERVRNGEFAPGSIDQFDTGTTVEWLTAEGDFSHNHDKRIFLEKYEMPDDDPRKELMEAASWLIQGKGGLDYFTMQLSDYKEKLQ